MIKSDGNGGYNIRKGTLALIMVLIALFSCITTVVAYGVTLKADVDHLKTAVDQAIIDQDGSNNRLLQNEKAILVNQERIIAMHEDLSEIKEDVKELIAR